jgi:hypothetical protein
MVTYDVNDWRLFEADGLKVIGPESVVARSRDARGR